MNSRTVPLNLDARLPAGSTCLPWSVRDAETGELIARYGAEDRALSFANARSRNVGGAYEVAFESSGSQIFQPEVSDREGDTK